MKKIPALLEDRDKTVRDETKALVVEIYRYFFIVLCRLKLKKIN